MELKRCGRVWKFGDQINTDLILPAPAMRLPAGSMHTLAFEAIRPGWVKQVRAGDVLLAGREFGLGSSRPIGTVLRACGIGAVIAESINGLAFRNCLNASLPALACEGVTALFEDGDIAEIDFLAGSVHNARSGRTLSTAPLAVPLAEIVAAGGIIPMLIEGGFIESTSFVPAST